MTRKRTDQEAQAPARRDALADEADDPQTRPDVSSETARENAATSLDQPSDDVG